MLSCELCCSLRAVRLLRLILLQQNSLKKPVFSQMLCLREGGVGAFLMSVHRAVLPSQEAVPSLFACRGSALLV